MRRNRIHHSLPGIALILCSLGLIWPAIAQDLIGATMVGSGFTGRPFALEDDIVLDSSGLVDAVRNYAPLSNRPSWIGWNDHGNAYMMELFLHHDDLGVALGSSGSSGLTVLDLSDLSAIQISSRLEGNYYNDGVLLENSLLVNTDNILISYDLTDPGNPVFTTITMTTPRDGRRWFSLHDDILYFVEHDNALRMLSMSDPLNPVEGGTLSLGNSRIDALACGDGVLYVLLASTTMADNRDLELVTFSLADALNPVEVHRQLVFSGEALSGRALSVDGETMLVGTNLDHLQAFDLTNPLQPEPGFVLPLSTDHLTVSASFFFVESSDEVCIFARTTADVAPGPPVERTMLPRLATVTGEGPQQLAQLHSQRSVVRPIDVTNAWNPTLGDPVDTGINGYLFADGGLAVMVGPNSFRLIDNTDPAGPQLRGMARLETLWHRRAMLRSNLFAVFCSTPDAIVLYDIQDLDAPVAVGQIGTKYGFPIDVDRGLMLVGKPSSTTIFDVSDPSRPLIRGTIRSIDEVRDAAIHDGYAYILAIQTPTQDILKTYNLADPYHPELVATDLLLNRADRLYRFGDRLYALGFNHGQIMNLASPESPETTGTFPTHGTFGEGLAVHGSILTVSGWLVSIRDNSMDHVGMDETTPHASCRLSAPYPNPFNPRTTVTFEVNRPQELSLSVHDLRGRKIAELVTGSFQSGRHQVQWDGRTTNGNAAPSGVYLIRLHGQGIEASRTATLLK